MGTIRLFSFAVDNSAVDISASLTTIFRIVLLSSGSSKRFLSIECQNSGNGRYDIYAAVDNDDKINCDLLIAEALSLIQHILLVRATAFGWPSRQYEQCTVRHAGCGVHMRVQTILRKIRSESADGVPVLFFDTFQCPRFSVTLGATFKSIGINRRAQFYGQVGDVCATRRYRSIGLIDVCDGYRAVLIPQKIEKLPTRGSTIYALLSPLRSSRLAWQLEQFIEIQRHLF